METQTHMRALITDISGTTSTGTAEALDQDQRVRLLKSLKRGGLFFLLAVVSILVPILHFVLVPAFLILAGVFFAKTMGETKVISRIVAECPSCRAPLLLNETYKMSGTKESCPSCRQLLKIRFEP